MTASSLESGWWDVPTFGAVAVSSNSEASPPSSSLGLHCVPPLHPPLRACPPLGILLQQLGLLVVVLDLPKLSRQLE